MPHKIKGEGFFIAGLRKKGNAFTPPHKGGAGRMLHSNLTYHPKNSTPPLWGGVGAGVEFSYISDNNHWIAIPTIHYPAYIQVKNRLKIISAGVALGEMKGKDRIPAHHLAMSNVLSDTAFPQWEVNRETALAYLRKEALQNVPPELPKGYLLITYKKYPLGFVKNIGTRANNLYPQEWRIRMKNL